MYKIKDLDFKGYHGYKYKQKDFDFLVEILQADFSDEIYISALGVFLYSKEEYAHIFLNYYENITSRARILSIPMLATSDSVKIYAFLILQLKDAVDFDELELISGCLAETHYPVAPLIIENLITDNEVFLIRLKQCLRKIGLKKLTHYLMLSPQIPFEAILCELFGKENINQIKQRK